MGCHSLELEQLTEKAGDGSWLQHWVHRMWTPEDWDWAAVEKTRNPSLTAVGWECRNRYDDGNSWMPFYLLHLRILDSFLSTTSFCSSQWYEVCVSARYYFLVPFLSAILLIFSPKAWLSFVSPASLIFFSQLCSRSVLALILLVG